MEMKSVKTKDETYTLYSEEYKEHYNSVSGALEEAFKKYVEPCGIKAGMKILDIGFGLGYNVGAAIYTAKQIKIVSLEKDKEVLTKVNAIKVPDWFSEAYSIVKKVAENLRYKDEYVEIEIVLGDAVETIKKIDEKFDAVFLDPFSHPKNPKLWSLEFLKDVFERMNSGGRLATYSCASAVRKNLIEAGLNVFDGPCVGRRAPATVCVKL